MRMIPFTLFTTTLPDAVPESGQGVVMGAENPPKKKSKLLNAHFSMFSMTVPVAFANRFQKLWKDELLCPYGELYNT